ncbi:polysaccharide deacetylase family protein [Altericista sp. CCNU0014]|uniref:polysaccharide deacetylase family protein n=1 Tax=Altericista sp. CCNU0014 TaxID=3082949 RepID=UPI00384F5345
MLARAIATIRQPIARLRKSLTTRGLILMYHRIGEPDMDPWSLRVTPAQFSEHLQILRQQTHPMSLHQLARAHRTGNIPERACVVTFDDGYANNFYLAKPLLEAQDIPATVFVTTGYADWSREFWWDELEQILLRPGILPPTLELEIDGIFHQWHLTQAADYGEADYRRDRSIEALAAVPGSRLAFYRQVWQALQPLAAAERQQHLDSLQNWAQVQSLLRPSHRPMTVAELNALEAGGLVTVGAHTVHHPLLSHQTTAQQRTEICESKSFLEDALGHEVSTFAYPFGVYDKRTPELLQDAGFDCACSTVEETVWHRSDRFQLPRFAVRGCSGETFERQLFEWLRQ